MGKPKKLNGKKVYFSQHDMRFLIYAIETTWETRDKFWSTYGEACYLDSVQNRLKRALEFCLIGDA